MSQENAGGVDATTPYVMLARGEQQAGPFSLHELATHYRNGEIGMDDLVWYPGLEEWLSLRDLPKPVLALIVPPPPLPARPKASPAAPAQPQPAAQATQPEQQPTASSPQVAEPVAQPGQPAQPVLEPQPQAPPQSESVVRNLEDIIVEKKVEEMMQMLDDEEERDAKRKAPAQGIVQGLTVLPLVAIAVGIAGGAAMAYVGQFFYLMLIFPFAAGMAIAVSLVFTSKLIGTRSSAIGVSVAVVASIACYITFQWMNYQYFRDNLVEEYAESRPDDADTIRALPDDQKASLVDGIMRTLGHTPDMMGYLDYVAKDGFEIASRGRSATIEGIGVWILWIAEWVFLAVIAGIGGYASKLED